MRELVSCSPKAKGGDTILSGRIISYTITPGRVSRSPLPFTLPLPCSLSARIPHKPSRRVRRPDDDIFTVGGEGHEIRAQLPLEEPHRTEYTSNKPSQALLVKTFTPPRGDGLCGAAIGNVDQTADTPLAPLLTNSPVETLAGSTVYAFLTRRSF